MKNILDRMPLSKKVAERLGVTELDGYPSIEVINSTYTQDEKLSLMDKIESEMETADLKRSMMLVSYSCRIKA